MSKKEKTSSNFLNSAKEYEDNKDQQNSDNKIKVDRTYIEPQEFQSKTPKRRIRYSSFQD